MTPSLLGLLIIGGQLATPNPSVPSLTLTSDGESIGHCTAEVVGSRSILTAKHCSQDSKTWVEYAGIPIEVDHWIRAPKSDFSLGIMKAPLPTYPLVIGPGASVTDSVTISGFGCYDTRESYDGLYRLGGAVVDSIFNDEYLLSGPAVVCPGDSGGPTFNSMGDLIGITSAVEPWTISHVERLDTEEALKILSQIE